MIKEKLLDKTISENLSRIAKIFADEFTMDSVNAVRDGFNSYMSEIVEDPSKFKVNKIPFNKFNCVM